VPSRTERAPRDARYTFRFVFAAVLLVSITLVLVLVVLPERYVLESGFRESGTNFPAARTPFVPIDPVQVPARPVRVLVPDEPTPPGPAELFWTEALPLLNEGRYAEVMPVFERYLDAHPRDEAVRLELARTLIAAGRPAEAVAVLRDLVSDDEGDRPTRLLLARTLRDLGRIDEASAHYGALVASGEGDVALALEWARALAWLERYDEAETVLRRALDASPGSAALRIELARVYYYTDRLTDAESMLAGVSGDELVAAGAGTLLDDVRAALFAPAQGPLEESVEPTLLERALAAREADDFETARMLLGAAMREAPDDPAVRIAFANLLEYELADFDGARDALAEAIRLGGSTPELELRLARLEAWTQNEDAALARLDRLLQDIGPDVLPDTTARTTRAGAHALAGDLHRWRGDRVAAARAYHRALASDPAGAQARAGIDALRTETALQIEEIEGPGIGPSAYGLADTDDFERLDLGGAWTDVRDLWVWSGNAGTRWVGGRGLAGGVANEQGYFVEVAPARWWRWGTIRTAVHVGAETVRAGQTDVSFGAALRWRALAGGTLDVGWRHEPAYGFTGTLQSMQADVVLDRFQAGFGRALDPRWSIALQTDIALLDPVALAGAPRSTRLQGVASVGRTLGDGWTLGWSGSAATYTGAAPTVGGLRLYWDPSVALATGPWARVERWLADRWQTSLRVAPGVALIEERGSAGLEAVPQLNAEARLGYAGERLRSGLDVFYGQARLEGYRNYGVRFSVSSTRWLGRSPER
jgi:tetratricopeptide (TPR) repeat protein